MLICFFDIQLIWKNITWNELFSDQVEGTCTPAELLKSKKAESNYDHLWCDLIVNWESSCCLTCTSCHEMFVTMARPQLHGSGVNLVCVLFLPFVQKIQQIFLPFKMDFKIWNEFAFLIEHTPQLCSSTSYRQRKESRVTSEFVKQEPLGETWKKSVKGGKVECSPILVIFQALSWFVSTSPRV